MERKHENNNNGKLRRSIILIQIACDNFSSKMKELTELTQLFLFFLIPKSQSDNRLAKPFGT